MNNALVAQPTVLANSVLPVMALRASRPYRRAAVAKARLVAAR